MTQAEKYESIRAMASISEYTHNKYPTRSAFKRAIREGRVAGDYDKRIVIVSDDPRESYTFVND